MKWGMRLLGCAIVAVMVLFVLAGMLWIGARVSGLEEVGETIQARPGVSQSPAPFVGGEHRRRFGTLGSVVRVENDALIVKGRFGAQRTVRISQDTVIERDGRRIQIGDVKPGEWVVIIGAPRPDGTLAARFIRVFDQVPDGDRRDHEP